MRISKIIYLALLFMVFHADLFSQQHLLYLHSITQNDVERSLDSSNVHLAMKPLLESRLDLSRTRGFAKDTTKYYYLGGLKLWRDHLVKVEKEDFRLYIDPLLDLMLTVDLADTSAYRDSLRLFNNTRGLMVQGSIGNNLSFQTGVLETQVKLPLYQKYIADSLSVIPGMGRWKIYKTSGYDYSMSFGYLSLKIRPWLHTAWGYGKNFIGHGYRSVLLSDASFSYPYMRATAYALGGKLQYTSIYASLQTLERMPLGEVPESLFKRKAASFHYLSWTPAPSLEVGLFEGIIWQRWDSTGTRSLPLTAYVPVLGLNAATRGFEEKQNVLAGVNLRYRISSHFNVYGQYLVDDFSNNKSAFQLGFKWLDLAKGLDIQAEYNSVSASTYSSQFALQNYEHYNQPLGHPAGPGSDEFLTIVQYRYKKWFFRAKAVFLNEEGGINGDLFYTSGEDESDSLSTRMNQWDFETGFFLNPKTNMQFLVGFTDRISKRGDGSLHSSLIFVAWRTSIWAKYNDF
jgi:hypothetical protein